MPTAKYSNYLEINPSFESVVDIDADTRNTNLWREYIVGDDMESLVEQMCQSIGNEAPDLRRSFWIHGSYGTGKSYAACSRCLCSMSFTAVRKWWTAWAKTAIR